MEKDNKRFSFIEGHLFSWHKEIISLARMQREMMNVCKDRREIIHVCSPLLMSHSGLKTSSRNFLAEFGYIRLQ